MKISPSTIKKELEEKRLAKAEAEKAIQLKERVRQSKFNRLMDRCLEAAIAGENEVDLGYEFYDLKDVEEQILDKWIDIKYLSKNDYLIKKISKKIKFNSTQQFIETYTYLNRAIKQVIACLDELKPYVNAYENIYFEFTVSQIQLAQREVDIDLSKCIFYILQAKDAFNVLLFDFDAITSPDLLENVKTTRSDTTLWLQELSNPYETLLPAQEGFLKKTHAICLTWDKKIDANSEKNSTDDELDAYSFTYLASSEGQSFIDRLKNLVEQEMAIDNNRLFITLSKIGNRNSIKLSDSEEIKTVYNKISLERLLIRFGYRLEKQLSGEDESNYLLTWKN